MSTSSPRSSWLKRFLQLVVLAWLATVAIGWLLRHSYVKTHIQEMENAEERKVAIQRETLTDDFNAVITDLLYLVENSSLRHALESGSASDLALVAAEFRTFAAAKKVYDQVRFIDAQGMEMVRVNFAREAATIVPSTALQSKQDRYYFQEIVNRDPGYIFVSRFDLNVEDGKIEEPRKPTIRFGTPLFDSQGNRRGVLVLNYLGETMLERFARLDADSPGRSMLLDTESYWLYAGDPELEWGFMFSPKKEVRFAIKHPEAWSRMVDAGRGQILDDEGIFTFSTVYPRRSLATQDGASEVTAAPVEGYGWKVVSHVTPSLMLERTRDIRYTVVVFAAAAAAILTGVCFAVARLVADRESSQRALRQSEEKFRQMAESMDEAFWLTSADRRQLLYLSPAFEKIWGHPCTTLETARRAWLESIHPDDRLARKDAFCARNGEPFSVEYRIVRSDGEMRWIWDRGFAVRDESGHVVRYAGIAEDVSALKEAQQNLLKSERLAAIGEAIAGLAHESRNALQRSQACLEMLQKRIAGQPEAGDLASRIQAALRDLYRLYERVRTYAGPILLEKRKCDLRDVWRRACEDVEHTIQQRHAVVVEAPCPPDLDTTCLVDELALRRVYCNILENALSEELDADVQRDRVVIEICWEQATLGDEPAVQCVIRDNGPGCAHCQKIFDPFFTTKAKGTGLGLAICRGIVEAHGGLVTARSLAGRGLWITIVLSKGPREK